MRFIRNNKTSRLTSKCSSPAMTSDLLCTCRSMNLILNIHYNHAFLKKYILMSHRNESSSWATAQSLRFTTVWWKFIEMSRDLYLPSLMKKIWQILFKISGFFPNCFHMVERKSCALLLWWNAKWPKNSYSQNGSSIQTEWKIMAQNQHIDSPS